MGPKRNTGFVSRLDEEGAGSPGPGEYLYEKSIQALHDKKFGKVSSLFGSCTKRF